MTSETWFRGVSGLPAAKRGAFMHPLGDGVYFSDKESVAWDYATSRWNARNANSDTVALDRSKQKVFEVAVKRQSMGRVLDLTTDPRWRKMLNQKLGRSGQTFESLLRTNVEMHNRFFMSFLQQHDLKLSSFDAVIGRDYETGGRYLCVVDKGGLPSPLRRRLEARMKPVTFRLAKTGALTRLRNFLPSRKAVHSIPFRPSSVAKKSMRVVSAGKGPGGGGGRGGKAGVLGAIGIGIIVDFAFILLEPWLTKKFGKGPDKWLEEDLTALKPQVDSQIQAQSLWAASLLAQGTEAWANITMTLETRMTGEEMHGPYLKPKQVDVKVTGRNIATRRDISPSMGVADLALSHSRTVELVTISAPIDLPEASVAFYKTAVAELRWYRQEFPAVGWPEIAHRLDHLTAQDRETLREEQDGIIADLAELFSVPFETARLHVDKNVHFAL